MDGGAPHVQIMAIPARSSPPFSFLRHSAPRGIFFKNFILTLLNPMPRFLNPGVGIAGINSTGCVTVFNHMNAGAPYSAIYVYIFLKLMILCVGVPEFLWLRFNTYNNHPMLFKISQIFCQYCTFWRIFQAYPSLLAVYTVQAISRVFHWVSV